VDRLAVPEPYRAIRVDEELVDDSDISCDALGAEAHREAVDMGLQMPAIEFEYARLFALSVSPVACPDTV